MTPFPTRLVALAALIGVAGCNTVPPTNVHQPMTARPLPVPQDEATPGSIYQNSTRLALFEIKRARAVGDLLTIKIEENTNAQKKGSSSASKKQSSEYSLDVLAGLPGKSFLGSALGASSDSSFQGQGASSSNGSFTGTITTTVVEVLANGNLLVSGEKQLGINQGTEYIRFSGVVDPATIGYGNTVSSTKVADARIEYRGTGYIDSAQVMGWLARFFLTFLPF